jgi:hypothetical protein
MGFKEDFRERLNGIAGRLADKKRRDDRFREEWDKCRDQVIGPIFEGASDEFSSAIGQYGWKATHGRENGSIFLRFTNEQGNEYELRFKPTGDNNVSCTSTHPNVPLNETLTVENIQERTITGIVTRLIDHLFSGC